MPPEVSPGMPDWRVSYLREKRVPFSTLERSGDPEDPHPDRIPACNGAMVAAMAQGAGAKVRRIGPLPDDGVVARTRGDDAWAVERLGLEMIVWTRRLRR